MAPDPSPMGWSRAPFEVYSIQFNFPGSAAIRLRDPVSDEDVSIYPEWIVQPPRNEPAAYVRGTQPSLVVVFRGAPAADDTYVVGADGTPTQIEENHVSLTFDPQSGLSMPIVFHLKSPLPDQIGRHSARFDWYVRKPTDPTICLSAGGSSHWICTTWRAMGSDPTGHRQLNPWVYKQLMEWTCEWAAGQNNEKDICDAIIRNLSASGLRYGVYAHEVREMLRQGGGMCGGWYQMFQQMAHCQGVFVHCRSFRVDWRQLPNGEVHWCAIVIKNGGLNQTQPTHPESEFHDNEAEFPITTQVALAIRHERRYRFWGSPTPIPGFNQPDGHCINFLEYGGRLYLYDACFGTGPFEIDACLPPDDFSILGGVELSRFKARYLDAAVDYMLGTLYNGNALYRSDHRQRTNGMTVKTTLIPEQVHERPGLTFAWGP